MKLGEFSLSSLICKQNYKPISEGVQRWYVSGVPCALMRNTVKGKMRLMFQIIQFPNYAFNYSYKTSKMTPDRDINDLGKIKYL